MHRMQAEGEELQGVLARWSGALRVRRLFICTIPLVNVASSVQHNKLFLHEKIDI